MQLAAMTEPLTLIDQAVNNAMQQHTSTLPSREYYRLCTHIGLTSNASHMGKVSTPLPAVQSVFPALSNSDSLQWA